MTISDLVELIIFLFLFLFLQIVLWRFLHRSKGSDVATKQALIFVIFVQYIPRFVRILPLTSELKRTAGVFAETAWAGAVYYLLLYMLASHVRKQLFEFHYYMIPCWILFILIMFSAHLLKFLSFQGILNWW